MSTLCHTLSNGLDKVNCHYQPYPICIIYSVPWTDGFHLAAGVASTVQLHDAKSGRHLRTLHSHKVRVTQQPSPCCSG